MAGRAVKDAQPQQVAQMQLVVADRLLGDEDRVWTGAQALQDLPDASAEEVGVAERGSVRDRVWVDSERVLEVGSDVCVGVINSGGPAHARNRGDLCLQP